MFFNFIIFNYFRIIQVFSFIIYFIKVSILM